LRIFGEFCEDGLRSDGQQSLRFPQPGKVAGVADESEVLWTGPFDNLNVADFDMRIAHELPMQHFGHFAGCERSPGDFQRHRAVLCSAGEKNISHRNLMGKPMLLQGEICADRPTDAGRQSHRSHQFHRLTA
jgi:hypothetical protein